MVSALQKLKANLQSTYGDNSAMTTDEMPYKGVVSSGSLRLDYMLGVFGIPRDIVMELGGEPGVSKTTMSLCIINNVLKLEYDRALMRTRVDKAVKKGALSDDDRILFDVAYRRQQGDLHVFTGQDADKKNKLLDDYELTQREIDSTVDNTMRDALFLDLEGRFSPEWAARFIDKRFLEKKLLVVRPDTIEDATDIYREAVGRGIFAVAVVDSIGGAPTKQVADKSANVSDFGGNSKPVTRFADFAAPMSSKHTCLTICINQVRADMSGYHSYITPGGWGLKHACSVRIELKRKASPEPKPGEKKNSGNIPKKDDWVLWDVEPGTNGSMYQCGFKVSARLRKTSVGRPGQACEFYFYTHDCKYGKAGFDSARELVSLAVLCGDIEQSGAWFTSKYFKGAIQGVDKLVKTILEDKDIFDALYKDMSDRLHQGGIEGALTTFDVDSGYDINEETGELMD